MTGERAEKEAVSPAQTTGDTAARCKAERRPSAPSQDGLPGARKSLLWRGVDAAVLLGVSGMLLCVTLQVLSRLQAQSLPWTEEVTRYLFIWTTFFGMAAGFRSVEHTRITLLLTALPRSLRRVSPYLYFAAGVLFFCIVGYTGAELVVQQYRSGESSPALGLGLFLVTAAVVAGAALSVLAHFETLFVDRAARDRLGLEDSAE
ncbi:MAG: TRAP transporter small permease [Hyphomicrobiales bacterium]|nr:TRAP transporter small permease [Hyphomicrobiales bacterium]